MKKSLLTAAILAGITFSVTAADTIRFASSATYPPFESLDANNQMIGFDIDLAKALCKQMHAQCTFTNQAFDSLIATLKFKKYDAVISGMDITPARSKQVSFTQPYYANSAMVIAKKGQFDSLANLKGKKLGIVNGTTHQKYVHDKHPDINTVTYDGYQTAILELKNGRVDGMLGDTAVVAQWLKTNADLVPVGEHITDAQYFGVGLGIAVRPSNQDLLTKLNTALDAVKADGTYKTINDKWFPQ